MCVGWSKRMEQYHTLLKFLALSKMFTFCIIEKWKYEKLASAHLVIPHFYFDQTAPELNHNSTGKLLVWLLLHGKHFTFVEWRGLYKNVCMFYSNTPAWYHLRVVWLTFIETVITQHWHTDAPLSSFSLFISLKVHQGGGFSWHLCFCSLISTN